MGERQTLDIIFNIKNPKISAQKQTKTQKSLNLKKNPDAKTLNNKYPDAKTWKKISYSTKPRNENQEMRPETVTNPAVSSWNTSKNKPYMQLSKN